MVCNMKGEKYEKENKETVGGDVIRIYAHFFSGMR